METRSKTRSISYPPVAKQDQRNSTTADLIKKGDTESLSSAVSSSSIIGRGKPIKVTERSVTSSDLNISITRGRGRGVTPRGNKLDFSSSIEALKGSLLNFSLNSSGDSAKTIIDVPVVDNDSFSDTSHLGVSDSVEEPYSVDQAIVFRIDSQMEGQSDLNDPPPLTSRPPGDNPDMNSLHSLVLCLQQSLSNTQAEIRSIRDTISQQRDNQFSSSSIDNGRSPSNQMSTSSSVPHQAIKLKDWNVSFSGEGSVSDFIFKIDTLSKRSHCSVDYLMDNFQIFLTNKAETWYWRYIRQHPRSTFDQLKNALNKEFGSLESDNEVKLRISTRRQHNKESYDDYHTAIMQMNQRLRCPLSDSTLIEIMRENVNSELRLMLFGLDFGDVDELREIARRAERIIKENKSPSNQITTRQRHINELRFEDPTDESEGENDPQIEVLKINKPNNKNDYSRIKCWNCLNMGHSFIYCPETVRHVFCYKCGERNVTTLQCSNAHKGNLRRSEMATGDSRSSN
ncbi:uncharacterized protein LOC142233307 [Haematobia irritans]|uniref:uncharacterized protein LOC142233307 n=1 Tax=Haematobia irritans TaxID=7368 RepID=UPI003F504A18